MKRKLFEEARTTNLNSLLNTGLKGIECPYGTVPIRRVRKDDLARTKMLSKMHPSNVDEEPGHHVSFIFSAPKRKGFYFLFYFFTKSHILFSCSMQYFEQKLIPIESLMELNHTFV
jgi:hypothetical protein